MATDTDLSAELRDTTGKGAARRLRLTGKVPAVLYGGGHNPRAITLDQNQLLRKMENDSFYSSIITIQVGKETQRAIIKDLQRHPAKRAVLHVDLQRVLADEKIRMNVPIRLLGEEEAVGVSEEGGVISRLMQDVEISCLPKDLPEFLQLDITALGMDEVLNLSDISSPEGVEITDLTHGEPNDRPVVAIHRPRMEEVEEVEEVEGEELLVEGEPVEGEETEAEGEGEGDGESKPEE